MGTRARGHAHPARARRHPASLAPPARPGADRSRCASEHARRTTRATRSATSRGFANDHALTFFEAGQHLRLHAVVQAHLDLAIDHTLNATGLAFEHAHRVRVVLAV